MTPRRRRGTARHKPPLSFYRLAKPAQRGQRDLVGALVGIGRIQHRRHIAGMHRVDTDTQGAIASSGSARRSRGSMRSGKSWLGSSANWRRPSVCWRAIAQARRERSRPSRLLHRPRQLLQRSGNAAAGLLRPRNQVTVVAPRQPSAIRCLPWQPAERSTKSLPLVRGLARTMSARPSPGTSGQAASKSATGSYTQAKRQRRRNTQRSDSAVNGRSRSSVTADRQVELTAAVSLAATTGGLSFLADSGSSAACAVARPRWRLQCWQAENAPAVRAAAVGCARGITEVPPCRRQAPFRGPYASAPRPRRRATLRPRLWPCGARQSADPLDYRTHLSERAPRCFPAVFSAIPKRSVS